MAEDIYVTIEGGVSSSIEWGELTGDINDQTDLKLELDTISDNLSTHTSNVNIHIDWTNTTDDITTTGAIGCGSDEKLSMNDSKTTYLKFNSSTNKLELYINDKKYQEWG